LTVDEFAFVIASCREARRGIEQVLQRRDSGETNLPAIENKDQMFKALDGVSTKATKRLDELRIDSELTNGDIEFVSDELAVAITSVLNAQRLALDLIKWHANAGNRVKVEHGKYLFDVADSALDKMQSAFQSMEKTNVDS
jgi:hypothetical protein